MRRLRRRAAALGVCSAVALAPVLAASPAVATGELGLSRDGVHWASSISGPLFDPRMRWVPGDSETATFYVRNRGEDAGDLTVDVLGDSVGTLMDTGDLRVTARGGGAAWSPVSSGGSHRLLSESRVVSGRVMAIDVTVTFSPSAGNHGQFRSADLAFRVTLSQSAPRSRRPGSMAPVLPPETHRPSGSPGQHLHHLLRTGPAGVPWLVAAAAALIGVGAAFVVRRPVQREDIHV